MTKLYEYSEDAPGSLSDVLLAEVNRNWSRENGTLAASDIDLPVGAVLAKEEGGNYVPYLKSAGNNQAIAMLLKAAPKNNEAQPVLLIKRGAVVASANLAFLASVTDAQKQTAFLQLTALGIVTED